MTDEKPLKSSLELAMERLRKKDADAGIESVPITDAQKEAIAEARNFYDSKIAEQEVLHQSNAHGQFTFVRIKYETAPGGYWAGGRPSWVHGFPIAEQNLMRIMSDLSYLNPRFNDVNVLTLDDPELFKYPVVYIIEVGWWTLTDREAAALRAYIQKGGFVIVDDFKMLGWRGITDSGGGEPVEANKKRGLPGGRLLEMGDAPPSFHPF